MMYEDLRRGNWGRAGRIGGAAIGSLQAGGKPENSIMGVSDSLKVRDILWGMSDCRR